METKVEILLDAEVEQNLTPEAVGLIKTEGFKLTQQITGLKVSNRDQYEKACEFGIANSSILKRIEALKKAVLMPLDVEKKRIAEAFDKAMSIFSANDEHIRKALGGYQGKVDVENIKTIHTPFGRATVQERKDWEVENREAIPQEYFKLDEAKIGRIVRAGGIIPGIKVTTEHSTAFVAA